MKTLILLCLLPLSGCGIFCVSGDEDCAGRQAHFVAAMHEQTQATLADIDAVRRARDGYVARAMDLPTHTPDAPPVYSVPVRTAPQTAKPQHERPCPDSDDMNVCEAEALEMEQMEARRAAGEARIVAEGPP